MSTAPSDEMVVDPTADTPTEPVKTPAPRLASLDALRGFDMFWIVGGGTLATALSGYVAWPWLDWVVEHLEHKKWDGFAYYDLIFPLFLFIAGVAMPFSLTRRLEDGERKRRLYVRVFRRAALLVLLGFIYNGLLRFDWETMRYPSVLGRIGLAYLFAALIVLRFGVISQFIWLVVILLGYWAAMTLIPVPGHGAGVLTMEGSLAGYVDRAVLPGRLYKEVHDPEGLLSTIPAIGTALLGALAGALLRARRPGPILTTIILAAAGWACLEIGELWNLTFPINKNLWTSSFALVAGGRSLLLLAGFYFVIDVCRLEFLVFPFIVIGMNPITIYLCAHGLIDFQHTTQALFGGALEHYAQEPLRPVLWALSVLLVEWLFLFFLYRKKVFLRV